MAPQRKNSTLADPFKLTLLIFAVIAFLYFAGEVLRPLALSVLLSFALVPAVRLLERRGVPRVAAVLGTVVITLVLMGAIGYIVGQQLTSLAQRLPDYQGNIETKLSRVYTPGNHSTADRIKAMANRVTSNLEKPRPADPKAKEGDSDDKDLIPVQVVEQPTFQE